MVGAFNFQKEWSEKIVFWVSYSKNKFLTANWLQVDDGMDYKLIDWLQNTNGYRLADQQGDFDLQEWTYTQGDWLQGKSDLLASWLKIACSQAELNKLTTIWTTQVDCTTWMDLPLPLST